MEILATIFNNLGKSWPALLIGVAIPFAVIITLLALKKKYKTAFKPVIFGFLSFFIALVIAAIILLILAQAFLGSSTNQTDANRYLYIGAMVALVLIYGVSEALKQITFRSVLKGERVAFAGLTFGSGFVLAQNLLVLLLLYSSKMNLKEMLAFGVIMVISGVLYLSISEIGYMLTRAGQWRIAVAMGAFYYAIFAVMFLFANVYVTYAAIALVLICIFAIGFSFLHDKINKGE